MTKKIVIIGSGPTGLGAAYRLKDLGHENVTILERNNYVGGLSASFKRDSGYTVDIGGHVLFSHYEYFDKAVAKALANDYLEHVREAWIWIQEKFVPYPFQNNIKYLPKEMIWECLQGLMKIHGDSARTQNFEDWVMAIFGEGIAKHFMNPYNFKVWAHPLKMMSKDWIAERVSVINFEKVLQNVILNKDDAGWGPNNIFKFPLRGGTGAIFEGIADEVRDKIQFNKTVVRVDSASKKLTLESGETITYDVLINTSPLDKFIGISDLSAPYSELTKLLLHSSGYSIGVGFNRALDTNLRTKCWNYFPEANVPFYRVTYLSNYSPNMVPDINNHFLLMCETSYSDYKKHSRDTIVDETIKGLLDSKFITPQDQALINFTDIIEMDYSYPIPSLERDKALSEIIPALDSKDLYSRGRFGLWRYETGNMDHSFMQGVEVVDKIISGKEEVTRYKN